MPEPTAAVRPARAGDEKECGRLVAAQMLERIRAVNPDYEERVADYLDEGRLAESWQQAIESKDGETVLVATESGSVVGFAAYVRDGERLEMTVLYVQADARHKGHGSRLLQAIADTTGEGQLGVWVPKNDEGSVRFYQGAGFGPTPASRELSIGTAKDPEALWVSWLGGAGYPDDVNEAQ